MRITSPRAAEPATWTVRLFVFKVFNWALMMLIPVVGGSLSTWAMRAFRATALAVVNALLLEFTMAITGL
jgi:hypothetical protein